MFYLGLTTGLRPGELLALEWQDIGKDEVRVRQTVTQPKGGYVLGPPKTSAGVRSVPMPSDAAELLYARPRRPSSFVFPSLTGSFMTPTNVHSRYWVPLLQSAGMRSVRPYVLRHTYATMQIAAGVDVQTLAKWMGHTDGSFTNKIYGHFFERRTATKAKTLAELLSGNTLREDSDG